jgi:pilus assembly protein Flp/PilA
MEARLSILQTFGPNQGIGCTAGARRIGKTGSHTFQRRANVKSIRNIHRSEAGATAIEYGLIAALIAVAAIAATQGLGSQLNSAFAGKDAAPQEKSAAK